MPTDESQQAAAQKPKQTIDLSADSPQRSGHGKGKGKPSKAGVWLGKGKAYIAKGKGFRKPALRGRGRGSGYDHQARSKSVSGNRANGPAAGSNQSAAPADNMVSRVKLHATGLLSQYKTATENTVALVLSSTEMSKELKRNELKTLIGLKKAELKSNNINTSTAVGDLFSTAYRAITEEGITIKKAKISIELEDTRKKHLAASLLPVTLVNAACIAANTYIKLHAGDLTDPMLKEIDAESMGFPAVVAESPQSLKASFESLKEVGTSVIDLHFSDIFTSNEADQGPDKFYRDTYEPLTLEASRTVVDKVLRKLKERALSLQLQASKDQNKEMIASAVAEKTAEVNLLTERCNKSEQYQHRLEARLNALEKGEKKRPHDSYHGHRDHRSFDRSRDYQVHPESGDASAVEQSFRNVTQKQDTYDRPGRDRGVPAQGRFYFNNSDGRHEHREYRYKTDDPPQLAPESISIDDNDIDTMIDQLSAAFDRPSNLQTAIHKVWLVDVDEGDIEELAGLTTILSEYGLSFTAKPSRHGKETISMINVIGKVNPVFDAAGGIHNLAAILSNDAGPPIPLNKNEIYVNKTLSEIPTDILKKYTVAQTDKGVGPAIISNRWLDQMKVKAICGNGFELIGVSKLPGFWSLDDSIDSIDNHVTHDYMLEQTIEGFLCAVDSASDIAPTDRRRSLREIVRPMSHQRELGYFSGLAKVLKVPAALRPNVDMSDTFTEVTCKIINAALQMIAKEFRKQHNSIDDYVTAEISESFNFDAHSETPKCIERMYMRLHLIQKSGVDMNTVRICPADIKEMFTEMDYVASIEDVKYICSLLQWDLNRSLTVEYKITIPTVANPNTGKPLSEKKYCNATVSIAEVLHMINCVCQHGLYICNCTAEAYLVRTISSLIMGVSFSPTLASLSGTANRVRLIMDVRNNTTPVFCRACLEEHGVAQIIHSLNSIHTHTCTAPCGRNSFKNEDLQLKCPFDNEIQLHYSTRYIDDLGEILFGDTEYMKQYLRAYYMHEMKLDILFSDPILQTPYCGQASDIAAECGPVHFPWLNIAIQSKLEMVSVTDYGGQDIYGSEPVLVNGVYTSGDIIKEYLVPTIKFVPYTKPGTNHGVKDGRSYMPDNTRKSIVLGQMITANAVTQSDNPASREKEHQFRKRKLSEQGYELSFINNTLVSWAKSKKNNPTRPNWKRPMDYNREAQVIVDYHDNLPNSLIQKTAKYKQGFAFKIGTRTGLPIGARIIAKTRAASPLVKARTRIREAPIKIEPKRSGYINKEERSDQMRFLSQHPGLYNHRPNDRR